MEDVKKVVLPTTLRAVFHPVIYAKTLIQLGHEPIPPVMVTTIFGKKALQLPNIFKYVGHIKRTDGFFGMYRGFGPRILEGIVASFAQETVALALKNHNEEYHKYVYEEISEEEEDTVVKIKRFSVLTAQECMYRCAGVIVGYPFHVIMVRSMACFVGGETEYNNIFSAISEIYSKEGISGFFAGLLPRLIGEITTIVVSNVAAHLITKFLIPKEQCTATVKNTTAAVCNQLVSFYTYPFVLTSNMMAVNNSGLVIGGPPNVPIFDSWTHCWNHLASLGELKRGSSILWRYYKGPTITLADGTLVAAKTF